MSEGFTCTTCGRHIGEVASNEVKIDDCEEPTCELCRAEMLEEGMRECGGMLIRVIRTAVERGDKELIDRLGNAWGKHLDENDDPDRCPDCGASPGSIHFPGCDIERCPYCGGQLLFHLCCEDAIDGVPADDRVPWTGEWPGEAECREFGWYAKFVKGRGWVPCQPDEPGAVPDLNRLHDPKETRWDRDNKRFVRLSPEQQYQVSTN